MQNTANEELSGKVPLLLHAVVICETSQAMYDARPFLPPMFAGLLVKVALPSMLTNDLLDLKAPADTQ